VNLPEQNAYFSSLNFTFIIPLQFTTSISNYLKNLVSD
jgi:hypothetical protein